ncbi:hypothetical protein, partial [Thiolapillus sp.]
QRKLVESWCEALPGLDKVEFLWLSSRVNQPLFDAACQMKSLTRIAHRSPSSGVFGRRDVAKIAR